MIKCIVARKLSSLISMIGALLLFLAIGAPPAAAQGNPIKVATYNIRVDTSDDGVNQWTYRKQNVVDLIKNKHAFDLFGVQEAANHQVTYLKSNLPGFDYAGVGRGSTPTSGEYSAIFYRTSRFQLLDQQTRWLSTTPTVPGSIATTWGAQYPRIVTQAKFKDLQTNIEFWVFNTHFEHGDHGVTARNNSAQLVKQWITDVGDYPVILTGDFNAPMGTTAMNTILSTPLTNTLSITQTPHQGHAATFGMSSGWTSISGSLVIDHIFVKAGIQVLDHRHATDQYLLSGAMRFPSDHLPVITSVILPAPSGGGSGTVTLKNGQDGYNGNVSFQVSGQYPSTHFGPSDYKHATNPHPGTNGYVYRAFYKFDVSPAASGIPAGAVITSATLQLRAEFSTGAPTDGGIKIHRVRPVNNAFTVNYAAATRNTYNGANAWTGGANAGGDVANPDNDFLDIPDGTTTLPPEGSTGNITFDVTSSVQAWVNGEPNNGWVVIPNARTAYLSTAADLNGPTHYPVLTVTYQSTPPSTTKLLKNGLDGYTGATSFHVSGQTPFSHGAASNYYHVTNSLPAVNGYMYRSFYKFDVSPAASGIPAGATITSARMRIRVEPSSSTSGYGVSVYRVAPMNGAFSVNYATATKSSYNGTSATWTGGQNAGGDVGDTDNDFIDTPVDDIPLPAVGEWLDFDVTSAVQAWVNGAPNNGLIVRPNNGANTITLRLSTASDAHGPSEYVTLEVTYH